MQPTPEENDCSHKPEPPARSLLEPAQNWGAEGCWGAGRQG